MECYKNIKDVMIVIVAVIPKIMQCVGRVSACASMRINEALEILLELSRYKQTLTHRKYEIKDDPDMTIPIIFLI